MFSAAAAPAGDGLARAQRRQPAWDASGKDQLEGSGGKSELPSANAVRAGGLIRGLVVFGRAARVAAGHANPRSARVRTPQPRHAVVPLIIQFFREVDRNLVISFVRVLCSLYCY